MDDTIYLPRLIFTFDLHRQATILFDFHEIIFHLSLICFVAVDLVAVCVTAAIIDYECQQSPLQLGPVMQNCFYCKISFAFPDLANWIGEFALHVTTIW